MGRKMKQHGKPATPKRPVPLSKLERQLPDQLDYLRRSIQHYDEGHTNEYRRMATTIRVLVHDTNASKSLLGQLSMEGAEFVSYARPIDPRNLLTEHSLAMLKISNERAEFSPPLDTGPTAPHRLSLQDWLSEPVLRDAERRQFSRWDIIRVVANQDGGAHVDPSIEEQYAQLQEGETVGWVFDGPEGSAPMQDIERCYLRHCAFEVVTSIDEAWDKRLGNRLCDCGSGRKSRYCCLKK